MTDPSRRLPVIQPGAGGGTPPVFDKIAVVGLGLIGGSIALAARELWPGSLVIGVDDKDVLERAMVRHAIDVAADDLVVMAEADLVVLAAPVEQNIALLSEIEHSVSGEAVVTDVGSTKRHIVERSRLLPPRLRFIGGHPLGGAPQAGIDYARADLFKGRPWLFTPADDSSATALARLQDFVTALGAVPHVMTADKHDRLLAFLSHLPQLASSTLMHVVGEHAGPEGLALTGRGLADTTRLAASPATIWRDICSTNADEITAALDAMITELQTLREGVSDPTSVDRVFDSAVSWRAVLARLTQPKRPAS